MEWIIRNFAQLRAQPVQAFVRVPRLVKLDLFFHYLDPPMLAQQGRMTIREHHVVPGVRAGFRF